MLIQNSDLIGKALNWAVAKCEGYIGPDNKITYDADLIYDVKSIKWLLFMYKPESDWEFGGPIIDNNSIELSGPVGYPKHAQIYTGGHIWIDADGPNYLVAAMRCYVASKLGNEIEIPDTFD
jgi:hypothetical protein